MSADTAAAPPTTVATEQPGVTSSEATAAPTSGVETTAPVASASEVTKSSESTAPAATETTTPSAPTTTTEATPAVVAPEVAKDGDLVKVEAEPITSGNLGHKKAGLTALFVKFKQFYFWLGDEAALDEATIAHFHKGDHEGKHHTAAHASQTGKGLLLYAKRAEDKTHPEGIFNLAEVSDVSKDGALEFSFKIHEKKHSFQATKTSERDGWIVAVNNAVTEAKANKSTLRESDAYKASHKNYSGAGAGALAAASTAGAATAAKDTKTEDAAVKNERRSTSRGLFGRGKSSDKPKNKETTKEKVEDKVAKVEDVIEKKKVEHAEKKAEKEEVKKSDDAVAAGTGAATTTAATETTSTPTNTKRRSIFGNFGSKNKTPATTEPVSSTAPKVDAPVEAGEPLTESVPTQATDSTPAATTSAATPTTKKETSPSRKLFGLGGRSSSKTPKESTPDAAIGSGPASTPFAASAVPAGAVKAEEATPAVEPSSTTAATSTTEPVVGASTTESDKLAATTNGATGTTKSQEKRRSSFAGLLGLGKNKESTTSKTTNGVNDTTGDAPKENKLTNLFRSSSKAAPKAAPTTENAPPVPSKDVEAAAPAVTTEPTPEAPTTVAGEAQHSTVTETTTADGEPATAVTHPQGTSIPASGSAQAV